jgi:prophage regulatory protein
MSQPSNALPAPSSARHAPVAGDIAVTFLRLHAVLRLTGLSRSTVYRLIADERFPRPVQLGPRAVAWRRVDVDAWSEARPTTTH